MARRYTYRRTSGVLTGEPPAYVVRHDDHAVGEVRRSTTRPRAWVARAARVEDWPSRHREAAWVGWFSTRAEAAASLWDDRYDIRPDWIR